ncbi:hypothetical protein F442_11069 [Phytophthora nicotianae P10297]|uniref:Uncharacterized protein n=1 Tax=Phytophthora nicotianae P10297 TaxID=1317064 RepID=W2Z3P9_PHYNI|nr:hypothetical protein F442_11069 [Phytophthora nicotianae P10297]
MQTDEESELKQEVEEAKRTIEQLKKQLGVMEQLLEQERNARVRAEFVAQQATNAAEVPAALAAVNARSVSVFPDQESISMERMLQQERAAREQAELAAKNAAVAARQPNPAPQYTNSRLNSASRSEDCEMEDVSNSPVVPEKSTRALSLPVHSELYELNRARPTPLVGDKRMSLADARKAAQEDMEKRIQERTKALLLMK